jgi:hypothetical protein
MWGEQWPTCPRRYDCPGGMGEKGAFLPGVKEEDVDGRWEGEMVQ